MGKSLVALRSDLLASCSAFVTDVGRVMDVPPADPRLALLEASLERFRRQASLKFDTVFPSAIEEYRLLREQAASKPTKTGALPSSSSGNGAGRTEAAPSRERTLQMARSILDQAHALQLQSMGNLGLIRDLDRTLAGTLMAEFPVSN